MGESGEKKDGKRTVHLAAIQSEDKGARYLKDLARMSSKQDVSVYPQGLFFIKSYIPTWIRQVSINVKATVVFWLFVSYLLFFSRSLLELLGSGEAGKKNNRHSSHLYRAL